MKSFLSTKKLCMITGTAIILAFLHSILLFDREIGLNFFLFVTAMLAGGLVIVSKTERYSRTNISLIMLALLFSFMVFVRSSQLLTFFNIVGTLLILLVSVKAYAGKKLSSYVPTDYLKMVKLPFQFLLSFSDVLAGFFSIKKNGKEIVSKEIVRGTFFALVCMGIFTLLFASADQVFGTVIANLFSFNFNVDLIPRMVVFCIMTGLCMGVFGYMLGHPSEEGTTETRKVLGPTEIRIVLCSVASLFLVFILFQISYFFGGASMAISDGLTYADYARKGFFELVVVAVLMFALLTFVETQMRKKDVGHDIVFKVISSILIVEVIAILVSAFNRLGLYEGAYGFTTIRLYSHAFMLWLGVLFVLLAHHILGNGTRQRLGFHIFTSVVLFLLAMNVLNPDAFITRKNIERYVETGKIDTYYIAHLSDDAAREFIPLLKSGDNSVRQEFSSYLYSARLTHTPEHWASVTWARMRAHKILSPYDEVIRRAAEEELRDREIETPSVHLVPDVMLDRQVE